MHPSESSIIPYQESALPEAKGVLVLAPHPDDEIFGCGGALARHQQAGHRIQVVLLTTGAFGSSEDVASDYAADRLEESARAADVLGLAPPVCWGLPDRGMRYGEELISRVLLAITEADANVVYAPSPWELHPDHRVVALTAMEAVRRASDDVHLYLYEVSAPLQPNTLLNVTSVWPQKQEAMRKFKSQDAKLPYESFITALNRFRALTLFPAAEYVEAFEHCTSEQLRTGGKLLIETQRERLRDRGVLVLSRDVPLVSIIVRTLGRSTLTKALTSVLLQTYTHLELVLVNASVEPLNLSDFSSGNLPIRLVEDLKPLGRSDAANAGMKAAVGEYMVFLDDDDWFYPDHISKLVRAVGQQAEVKAVHTAVECVNAQGEPIGETFDFAYVKDELRYGNFLPIHSVMFHRSLSESGCAFDPRFDLYEDWDFWLQVETRTSIGFVAGVSAAYRIHPGAGQGVQAERNRAEQATKEIFAKWGVLASEQTFAELVSRALAARKSDRQLQHQLRENQRMGSELASEHQRAVEALLEGDKARQDAHLYRHAHDEACAARDTAYGELTKMCDALHIERDARVAATRSIQQHQALIEQTRNDLLLVQRHAANLEDSLRITRTALDEARGDVQALRTSFSWRLSSPVRVIGRGVKAARNLVKVVRLSRSTGTGWKQLVNKSLRVIRREGLNGLRARSRQLLSEGHPGSLDSDSAGLHGVPSAGRSYEDWVLAYDTIDVGYLSELEAELEQLDSTPLVSVVMPVFNPAPEDLERAIASVRAQIYPHWELCICNDGSTDPSVVHMLTSVAKLDSRIRLISHAINKHISHASNSALSLATGKYIGFLDQDDELRPHSLLRAVQTFIKRPEVRMLYSDEDKINPQGKRFDPYFKSDFNIGLLRSHNYMCHFAVYEGNLLRELGGLRAGFEGAQDYDLALRAVDAVTCEAVGHIPSILYHWRTSPGSTAAGHGNKSYAWEAGRKALKEHLERRALRAEVEECPEATGMYRIAWSRPESRPKISIIIPTRNGHAILRQCLDSLVQTAYPHYEIIVVDNGSDEAATLELLEERRQSGQIQVLRDDRPFNFSALNNRAVDCMATGEFVLLLNNDIEAMHPEWLDELVGPAMESGVGCVGARLWYPDGRLQHAGVVLVCGVAGHAHKLLPKGDPGYMGRAVLAQDMVAVTGACLLVRKTIYEEVGGLDENLAVAFNDVDFCLRVHSAGYRNHWTPYAELKHHESLTQGYEDTPEKQKRFQSEIEILQTRWQPLLGADPFYNPNLTIRAEDFSLAWPPRVARWEKMP